MSIVYEVNVAVKAGMADRYREWVIEHAKDMYRQIEGIEAHTVTHTPSVDRSTIPQVAELKIFVPLNEGDERPSTSSDYHLFSMSYRIKTRAALDEYLAERAAAVRATVAKVFTPEEQQEWVAWRRVLDVIVAA
eukprot:GILI01032225.1.p1 GENE.GILI01032225.1~~GILI01032225.1.p1  ORF type:complete len:142 (-),score=32.11 GILI01032225.1:45-446(-)